MWQEYLHPASVEETLQTLAQYKGLARIVAGGTDLVLEIQSGECRARCLVDISRISDLKSIHQQDDWIIIGAAATHTEVAASPLVRKYARLLAEAAAEVGSPQIRNVGTIGGNVVNAQPAADTALALLALDAEAEIANLQGFHWLPVEQLYQGAGTSRVDSTHELVRAFRFRIAQGQTGSAYRRLGKCKSIALPVICAAVVVQMQEGRFLQAAIALGPVAPQPVRARKAEDWLAGKPASPETLQQAAELAKEEAQPRDSLLRCSRLYRQSQVSVLVRSTLEKAVWIAQ